MKTLAESIKTARVERRQVKAARIRKIRLMYGRILSREILDYMGKNGNRQLN